MCIFIVNTLLLLMKDEAWLHIVTEPMALL